MARPAGLTARGYLRAVESAWAKLRGRAVVLSPREYELVSGWHRRGIPLAVVIETLGHLSKRSGGRKGGARALTYAAPGVEAAWDAVAQGRAVTVPATHEPNSAPDPMAAWARAREAAAHLPLRELLTSLLTRGRSGASPGELDAALDRELPAAAPIDLMGEIDAKARASLVPFRDRMPAAEFERTFLRARVDGLREQLGLPRLALRNRAGAPSPRGDE